MHLQSAYVSHAMRRWSARREKEASKDQNSSGPGRSQIYKMSVNLEDPDSRQVGELCVWLFFLKKIKQDAPLNGNGPIAARRCYNFQLVHHHKSTQHLDPHANY